MSNEPPAKAVLRQLHKSLAILEERRAKYAGNAPLDLLHQIEDHRMAIDLTEQAINGDLSQVDWQEALRPLLVTIRERTSEAAGVILGDVGGDIVNSIIAGRDVTIHHHHHYAAEKPTGPLTLNTVPPPPERFIPRPREFNHLLDPLLNPAERRTLALTTALQAYLCL